jgi:hypothetical protein
MQSKPKYYTSSVWLYIFLWIFFVYLFIQILSFNQGDISNVLLAGLYFILYGIHEASHIITAFMPAIVTAASGSISEILFTGTLVVIALRSKSYFAASFVMLWMMLAMTSVGRYIADAEAQSMPLIGPGENPQHDWNFVLTELEWLQNCVAIGDSIRIAGYVVGALGLALGMWVIVATIAKKSSKV